MKLYQSIADDILAKIQSGVYQPGTQIPTEVELMQIYAASRVTVRKALEVLVSQNLLTRTPKKGTFINDIVSTSKQYHVIFLMLFRASQSLAIIEGAESYFRDKNISMSIKFSNCSQQSEREIIEDIIKLRVDGLILYPFDSNVNTDMYKRLTDSHIPVVFVDTAPKFYPCYHVSVENYHICSRIVEHLYENGHTNIAYLSQSVVTLSSLFERMQGFRAALKRFGLPCGKQNFFINADIDKAIEALLDTHPLPTAVFCGNDGSALRLMDVAQKRGIRIPDDLSLVGFDDIEEAATVTPALTTVRQPYREIGRNAGRLISEQLLKEDAPIQRVLLPGEFIVRNSVRNLKE